MSITFADLPLIKPIQEAIEEMGFTTPSPIQAQSIPLLLEGKDIIGQAQTGTGKTASFGIPIIQLVDSDSRDTQALILCPTRELALQVSNEIKKIAKHKKGLFTQAIYGGESIERQISALKKGVQIVIGTPGRVMDHMDRGTLKLDNVKHIVLDEADEMLNMGFREDIEQILADLPKERQTIFFSATMPKPILELTKKYQHKPELVKITRTEVTNTNIQQIYYSTKEEFKIPLMASLIEANGLQRMLVFCNTKKRVDEVVEEMIANGYAAEGLHGDMKQAQRNNVMGRFRNGNLQILVATDVAARGIDVDDVDGVFNYDLPLDVEYYVHRIGRTGRAGKTGTSFSFVSGRKESYRLRDIEDYIKTQISKGTPPSGKDLVKIKITKLIDRLKLILEDGDLSKYKKVLAQYTEESGLSAEDIAVSLLKLQLGEIEAKKQSYEDYQEDSPKKGRERGRETSGSRSDRSSSSKSGRERNSVKGESSRRAEQVAGPMARLFVNLGKKDRISPGDIVGAFTGETGIKGNMIGEIKIMEDFSFVEVPVKFKSEIINRMTGNTIKGKKVNVELASARKR